MKNKKVVMTAAVAGAMTAVLLGSTAVYAEGDTITIAAGAGWVKDIDKELAAKYEEESGNKIEWQVSPDDQYENVLGSKLAVGEGADIFYTRSGVTMQKYQPDKYMMDLSDQEWVIHYVDWAKEGVTYNDKILQFQTWSVDGWGILYNKDIFEEAGITEVPTTYQGWIDVYEKLGKDSGIDYAFCYQGGQSEAMVCNWVEFLASFGTSVLDEDGNPICNSQEAIDATQLMADYIGTYAPEGTTTYAETESQQVFQEGKSLTCRTWSGTWNTFNDPEQSDVAGKVGMTMLPVYKEGDTAHSCLGGLDLAVNTYIDDEHKEAAKTFIKWLSSEEEEKAFCLSSAQPPTVKAVYSDADVLEQIPFYTDFYSIIENGKGRPSSPDYSLLSDAIQRNVHSALAKEVSVEDALNALQDEAEALG